MSKKSGGISSLLKSDRAKKFKDTSFIWNSHVNEQKPSSEETESEVLKNTEEAPVPTDSKVGTNWEQTGNKLGTKEDVFFPPASQDFIQTIIGEDPSNPAALGPSSLPSEQVGTNQEQTGNKVGTKSHSVSGTESLSLPKKSSKNPSEISTPKISRNKLGTKKEQTGNKLGANQEQTGNKVGTIHLEQKGEGKDLYETGNKVGTKVGTVSGTMWEQIGNKLGTESGTNWEQSREQAKEQFNFLGLTGLQQKITYFFYEQCKSAGSKTTPNIALHYIAESLETTTESIKVSIKRLQKKNILKKSGFKNGRGGWSQYTLSDDVYREILQLETGNKLGTIWEQTRSKVGTNLEKPGNLTGNKVGTKVGTDLPSSSSFININNNTNTTESEDEWSTVQIPQLLRTFNFGAHIIKQVRDRNLLSPSELQKSLDAFSFDISENNLINTKKVGDPVRYFMGIISKKMQYAPPSNFATEEDKAFEENLKRLEEIKRKREEREKVMLELGFEEWLSSMTQEKAIQLVPESSTFAMGHPFCTQLLQGHYKKAILNGMSPDDPLPSEQ